jgi:transcriptional regulator with XRE-family HTH domain
MKDKKDTREIMASRLLIARNNSGLSQAQVATMLGLQRPSISEIEAGRRRVSAEELVQFASIYKTDISWLAGEDVSQVDPVRDKLQLAARNIAHLNADDLEKVIGLLSSVARSKGTNE